MELFVLSTPSMVINYENSHVSPFEGRGFRALGPIKKGDIYLKVRNVQILIFSGSVLTCYVLNFAGSLYHMLVSGQSKGCLQGRCFSLPQKLTDEHKQYVHCILVWNASPPFTILTKSKSQLDNSRIVKTLQLSLFGFLSNFSNWPKQMSKHLGVFCLMFFFLYHVGYFHWKTTHQELQQLSGEGKTLASLNEDLMALHLLLERSKGDAGGWNRWNTNFFWIGRCRFSLFTAGKIVIFFLMEQKSGQQVEVGSLSYMEFDTSKGWLALGFLNHQTVDVLDQVDLDLFKCIHVMLAGLPLRIVTFFAHHISLTFLIHNDWRKMCGSKRCPPHITFLDTQQYVSFIDI